MEEYTPLETRLTEPAQQSAPADIDTKEVRNICKSLDFTINPALAICLVMTIFSFKGPHSGKS